MPRSQARVVIELRPICPPPTHFKDQEFYAMVLSDITSEVHGLWQIPRMGDGQRRKDGQACHYHGRG
ncbi:hypothetical protein HF086_011097 [Spodoptera exigua]|uniref:Uncharacterized protein n=1 Tax=Spodoptera exigua TaxID=7107 RepID=A0A922MGJ5_SPOEX|nr:hypothetical protein HF086_011097 [Spodoptera exigua]